MASANAYRARHQGTPALKWDSTLAEKAQAYAELLLKKTLDNNGVLSKDIWVHDPENKKGEGIGENLYYGDGKKGNTENFCGFADEAW